MGDMADYALEQIDWEGERGGGWRPAVVECSYCGAKGLTWATSDRGYRLSKDGVVHTCREYFIEKEKENAKNSVPNTEVLGYVAATD